MKKLIYCILLMSCSLYATPTYQESFVAPKGFQPANHGSSVIELPGGDILVCWFAGSRESGRDVQIYCSDSKDLGRFWSSPRIVVSQGEYAKYAPFKNKTVGNTSLYLDDEKTLWLFYSAVMIGGWSGSHVDYKTSVDFGKTWSKSRRLIAGLGNLPRNKAIRLGVNQFFLPLYHEFTHFQGYGCTIQVSHGEIQSKECHDIPGSDHGQPAVVLRGNKIFAYLRTKKARAIGFSIFDRALKVWSEVTHLSLPNPNAAVEAETDSKGNVLLIFNDSDKMRSPLTLGYSKDGIDFKKIWDFETDPTNSFAYPSIKRGETGEYYVTYTYHGRSAIKFIRFNEEWLGEQERRAPF